MMLKRVVGDVFLDTPKEVATEPPRPWPTMPKLSSFNMSEEKEKLGKRVGRRDAERSWERTKVMSDLRVLRAFSTVLFHAVRGEKLERDTVPLL